MSVRTTRLTAEDLDLWVPTQAEEVALASTEAETEDSEAETSALDSLTVLCRGLLARYGGVIFRGPPGTGKSYFAFEIANALAGGDDRVFRVQFHPSYQYEDFIEGFQPDVSGGFVLRDRTFKQACTQAISEPDQTVVIIIDELSRVDCARVFGEAFTYLERSKRGIPFYLPSGGNMHIPSNLFVVATMNDRDVGVDALDAALERRFAMIEILPSEVSLVELLAASELTASTRSSIIAFFRDVNSGQGGGVGLGHAYFYGVRTEQDLIELWNLQLRFVLRRALALDPDRYAQLASSWDSVIATLSPKTRTSSAP
jgi:5-methylcytosine-specific restriction protein B